MRDMLGGFPMAELDFTKRSNATKLGSNVAKKTGAKFLRPTITVNRRSCSYRRSTCHQCHGASGKNSKPASRPAVNGHRFMRLRCRDFTIIHRASLNPASVGLLGSIKQRRGRPGRKELRTVTIKLCRRSGPFVTLAADSKSRSASLSRAYRCSTRTRAEAQLETASSVGFARRAGGTRAKRAQLRRRHTLATEEKGSNFFAASRLAELNSAWVRRAEAGRWFRSDTRDIQLEPGTVYFIYFGRRASPARIALFSPNK